MTAVINAAPVNIFRTVKDSGLTYWMHERRNARSFVSWFVVLFFDGDFHLNSSLTVFLVFIKSF